MVVCAGASSADAPGHACATVRADDARLACYDHAFGKPTLGSEQLPRAAEVREAEAREAALTAKVTGVERARDGKFTVTLDNGQVWAQSELDSRADLRVGDEVSVRRAALGSYLLSTAGGIATRVKRVR